MSLGTSWRSSSYLKTIFLLAAAFQYAGCLLMDKMYLTYSRDTLGFPCNEAWSVCAAGGAMTVTGMWINLKADSKVGLIFNPPIDGYSMSLPPGYVRYGNPVVPTLGPQYAQGIGYVYLMLVMEKSDLTCSSGCKLHSTITDNFATSSLRRSDVTYYTIPELLNSHENSLSAFYPDVDDTWRFKLSLHIFTYRLIGSQTYGRAVMTSVYFLPKPEGTDWYDPVFFKYLKRGGAPVSHDRQYLDTYYPLYSPLYINDTLQDRKDFALNRKNYGEYLGFRLPPRTEAYSSFGSGIGSGIYITLNLANFTNFLQTAAASVQFKLNINYANIFRTSLFNITAYFNLSHANGNTIVRSWFTAQGEGFDITGNATQTQGALGLADITSQVQAFIGASIVYVGDAQNDNQACKLAGTTFMTLWSDPYIPLNMGAGASSHRLETMGRQPITCSSTILVIWDVYYADYKLSYELSNIQDDVLKVGLQEANSHTGLIDYSELDTNYNFAINITDVCPFSVPEALKARYDDLLGGCAHFKQRRPENAGTYFPNCYAMDEIYVEVPQSRCSACIAGRYPDLMNFRELPMNTSCKKKDECQTTPGFVYVNNYEGTPFDYRGMCLSCPPNCNTCDANLSCSACMGNAVFNSSNSNCQCKMPSCTFCTNSTCDLCDYNTSLVVDQQLNRYCYVNYTARCGENYGLNSTFRYNNYISAGQFFSMCLPCATRGCRRCEMDYTNCTEDCATGTAPCDYKLSYPESAADFASYGTTSNCTNINTFIKGLVYDSNSGSFIPCIKGCIKCIATNTSECTRCVNDTVYLVDSLKCHSGTTCPPSTYLELAGGYRCKNCSIAHCVLCFDGSQECVNCETGYIFDQLQKKCIPRGDCNEANLQAIVNMTKSGVFTEACVKCPANCKTCSSNTTCSTCPSSYYLDSLSMCQKCLRGCSQCSSNTTCATCTGSGYIFHVENNICTLGTACNESINSTVFENYCRKCLDGCTKCSNVTSCEICATDFVKLPGGDSCLSECPLGYTNYLGICIECPAGCKICPSSGSTCTECLTGLSLLPNQSCIDCRLSGYTQIGANCEKCRIDKCAICNGNPSLCTQCTKNYTLSKNGTCIPCAAPMYLDLDSVCQPCDVDECAQCANSSMMCAVCNPGYVYEGSRCSLAIFGVVKGIFDKKSELIRLTFEQKLFVDEYSPYVQVTVIDKEGNDKKVAISKVEVIQGNLEIKLATEESFIGGVATISLTQPFMFLSSDRLGWTLSPNKSTITANDVTFNYPAKTTGASISQVGGGAAVSVVALITFVVSSNYAIMLIKIYQMMDFMLLYNTEYPRNFYRFIAIFEASNPIESLPDLLYWLYDDNCPEMGEKFIEQEYTCQFVPIVGPYLLFIIAYGILFVVFKVIDIIYKRTQNKKILQKSSNSDEMNESRDALMNPNEKKILAITPKPKPTLIDKAKTYALDFYYSTLGMKGVYMMVQSLDIRVLLAAAVNLQYYAGDVTTTTVSTFNRLLSGTIFIGHPLLLMYFAIETKRALDKGEDPKEHYLLEGRLLSGTYHKYREIFSLARNYAVSFLVVWLYETPLVQMSVLLAIVALSAGLEIKFRTYESKVAYICSGVLWVLYTASSLIFILQKLFGDLIGRSANEIVVGYPLIILFSGLISVNFVPGVFELIDAWRNRNKAKPSLEDEKDLTETKKKELAKQGSKKVAKRIIQGKKPINLVKKQPTLEQTRLRLASTTQGTELLGEADVKAAPKRILKGGTKITRAPRKASMETLNNTHTSLLGPTIKKSSMTKIKSLIKEQKTGTITEHPQSSKVIAKKEISPTQNIRSKSHKKTMQPSLDIPNLKRPTPEGTSLQESTMPLKKVVTARTRTTSKV